jgi:hypothetical protein
MDNLTGCLFKLSINKNDNIDSMDIENNNIENNNIENNNIENNNEMFIESTPSPSCNYKNNGEMDIDNNIINVPLHNFNMQAANISQFTSTGSRSRRYVKAKRLIEMSN